MSRSSVLWLTRSTADPMGQQSYESSIISALRPVLRQADLDCDEATFGSLRSPARYRLPARVTDRLPLSAVKALAYWQRPHRLVHRMDLRIPPTLLGPEVVTVHDLPPQRFPDEGKLPGWSLASARAAARVIAPSTFAADEIRTFTRAERIEVIPYGVSSPFQGCEQPDAEAAAALGLEVGGYVVHAAGVTQRKNLPALAEAWELVARRNPELRLVLCGSPSDRRTSLFGHLPRVVLPGKLRPEAIAALMSAALCVVVPSLYEGFGLPALEGMAVGTPVVAARRGALPEVCGDAALLVEPDAAAIAEAILDLAGDADERERLSAAGRRRAGGFSWSAAAAAHAAVYQAVLSTP